MWLLGQCIIRTSQWYCSSPRLQSKEGLEGGDTPVLSIVKFVCGKSHLVSETWSVHTRYWEKTVKKGENRFGWKQDKTIRKKFCIVINTWPLVGFKLLLWLDEKLRGLPRGSPLKIGSLLTKNCRLYLKLAPCVGITKV